MVRAATQEIPRRQTRAEKRKLNCSWLRHPGTLH